VAIFSTFKEICLRIKALERKDTVGRERGKQGRKERERKRERQEGKGGHIVASWVTSEETSPK